MQPDFQLTADEAALVENSGWILAKHRIIQKVYGLFGELSTEYNQVLEQYRAHIPSEVWSVSPKIYKGEMYRQMPYVMLDHPRVFSKTDIFAIRSFFWWGNHFSIHLVLSGKHLERFRLQLSRALDSGEWNGWYIGAGDDPWEHHFEADNYKQINAADRETTILTDRDQVFKLASFVPLNHWNDVSSFYFESYEKIVSSMAL